MGHIFFSYKQNFLFSCFTFVFKVAVFHLLSYFHLLFKWHSRVLYLTTVSIMQELTFLSHDP